MYALKADQCRASFYEFVKHMWDVVCAEKFTYNWHIQMLCYELQQIGFRIINRESQPYDLVINISPGETKSILVSQMFNAWLWTHDESIRFLGSSHTHSLSEFNSMMCQEIILSEKFIKTFGKIRLKENMKGKGDFMTMKNGRRKTTSVGTKITGSHFHCIAFDDIVDADAELSYNAIQDAKNHMTKCWSRKVDEDITVFILVMQRVATNDPTEFFKVLSTRKVKHIRLPAEDREGVLITPQEWRQFYKNGLMNPNRKTKEALRKIESKGIVKYNAQYLQSPNDLKGKTVKRDMFVFKKKSDFPLNFFNVNNKLIGDTAYTEKDKNDPSGYLICTYKDSFLYLLDFIEVWLEYPENLDLIEKLMHSFHCNLGYLENKASGTSLAQGARKTKQLNVADYERKNIDKKALLIDIALPMLQARRVVVVYDDHDNEQIQRMDYFVTCITVFKDDTVHDEAVDTINMAVDLCNEHQRNWS